MEISGEFESCNLSRDNLSREIGRIATQAQGAADSAALARMTRSSGQAAPEAEAKESRQEIKGPW